jgi:hypothetical protein
MLLTSMPLYKTFWQEFVRRSTIVYFMVRPEGEHHFRDVVSLMEIGRGFPHGLTQLRFCPVIPGVTALESPVPGEGIIILGRPEQFRSDFIDERILQTLSPRLQFSFQSNEPEERGYRTLRCHLAAKEYTAPPSLDTLTEPRLEDYAQVYFGHARVYESEEPSPCLILSGSSTLGTWGASVFVTSPYLLERHVGYSPWFQGVLSVALRRSTPGSLFLRPNLTLQVMESFFRACWIKVVYQGRTAGPKWRQHQNFQLFINDNLAATGADNWRCFLALALEQQERPGQSIRLREIEARLREAFAPPSLLNGDLNVSARLKEASDRARQHRVYIERTDDGYQLLLAGFEEAVA